MGMTNDFRNGDAPSDGKHPGHLLIVGLGDVVGYKYMPCLVEAKAAGHIDGYSILDLESQRLAVQHRLHAMPMQPEQVHLMPDRTSQGIWADPDDFGPLITGLQARKGRLKVLISTEVKAHESYLRYCVAKGIDSLVEKPVFAPMKDGRFCPEIIDHTMADLVSDAAAHPANHSVMTLGRYHPVYNEAMLEPLKTRMLQWNAPLTSWHLRTCSGVWNLFSEYEEREDHPYKYGYGMLMHGAYHYVDLMAQFLELNSLVYTGETFTLGVSSFAAFPSDQAARIPTRFSQHFHDVEPSWARAASGPTAGYGETDIVTSLALRLRRSGRVVTLGSITLEQTTPSIRAWRDFPPGFYNKNGRVSCTDVEAQLSTLFSIHGRSFKIPVTENGQIVRVDNFARVSTRANAALLPEESFNTCKEYSGFTNSSSNRRLFAAWLAGREARSTLVAHQASMRILQAIALSIQDQGGLVTVDLSNSLDPVAP